MKEIQAWEQQHSQDYVDTKSFSRNTKVNKSKTDVTKLSFQRNKINFAKKEGHIRIGQLLG